MPAVQTPATLFADCIGGLGVGVVLGVFYHVLRIITGYKRPGMFVRDIVFAPFAALFCYSYAVSFSFSGSLRFYMLICAFVGLVLYRYCALTPILHYEKCMRRFIALPARFAVHFLVRKIKIFNQKMQSRKKTSKKLLPKQRFVLYNSDR